jgi:hypothetical protein
MRQWVSQKESRDGLIVDSNGEKSSENKGQRSAPKTQRQLKDTTCTQIINTTNHRDIKTSNTKTQQHPHHQIKKKN